MDIKECKTAYANFPQQYTAKQKHGKIKFHIENALFQSILYSEIKDQIFNHKTKFDIGLNSANAVLVQMNNTMHNQSYSTIAYFYCET